jgi:hypothetical protein
MADIDEETFAFDLSHWIFLQKSTFSDIIQTLLV